MNYGYDDYDVWDGEDMEVLFVPGMQHQEEVRRHKNKGADKNIGYFFRTLILLFFRVIPD